MYTNQNVNTTPVYTNQAPLPCAAHPVYIHTGRHDVSFGAVPIPQEPCLHQSADELLKYVSELENKVGRIDDLLFGEGVGNAAIRPDATALQQKIAEACTRVACLCGLAGTIGNKLAG